MCAPKPGSAVVTRWPWRQSSVLSLTWLSKDFLWPSAHRKWSLQHVCLLCFCQDSRFHPPLMSLKSVSERREKRGHWFGPQRLGGIAQNKTEMKKSDVPTSTAASLSSFYVTGCCRMSHAAFLWSLCKQFTATVHVSVTIAVEQSPQIRFYHCYAIQRRLLSAKGLFKCSLCVNIFPVLWSKSLTSLPQDLK